MAGLAGAAVAVRLGWLGLRCLTVAGLARPALADSGWIGGGCLGILCLGSLGLCWPTVAGFAVAAMGDMLGWLGLHSSLSGCGCVAEAALADSLCTEYVYTLNIH